MGKFLASTFNLVKCNLTKLTTTSLAVKRSTSLAVKWFISLAVKQFTSVAVKRFASLAVKWSTSLAVHKLSRQAAHKPSSQAAHQSGGLSAVNPISAGSHCQWQLCTWLESASSSSSVCEVDCGAVHLASSPPPPPIPIFSSFHCFISVTGARNGGSWLGCGDLPAMGAVFYLGAGWPQWKPLGIPGTHLPLKRGSWLTTSNEQVRHRKCDISRSLTIQSINIVYY